MFCDRKRPMALFVHQRNQFLDRQEVFPVKIYANAYSERKITYSQFEQLPEIDYSGEITGKKGSVTCRDIDFDKCLYQLKEEEMRRQTKAKCTVPYTPNNDNVCEDLDDIRIAQLIHMPPFEGHKTAGGRISQSNFYATECPMNCKTLLIHIGAKSEINQQNNMHHSGTRNLTQKLHERETPNTAPNFKASFSPFVQKMEEEYLYSAMNLLAESGNDILIHIPVSLLCKYVIIDFANQITFIFIFQAVSLGFSSDIPSFQ